MTIPVYASDVELTQAPDSLSVDTLAGVAPPAGTVDGDLLVIFAIDNTVASHDTPAGWVALAPIAIGGTSTRLRVFWKIAATEPATYTFTKAAAGTWAGRLIRITGADTADPIVGSRSASGTPSISSANAGLTLGVIECLLLLCVMTASSVTASAPTGFVDAAETTVTAGSTSVFKSTAFSNGGVTGPIVIALDGVAATANVLLAIQPPVVLAPFMQGASFIIATPL